MVMADSRQFPWIAAVTEPQTERLVRYLAHLTAKGIQALLGFNDSFGSTASCQARTFGERRTGVHRNLTFPARRVSRSGILVMPHQPRRMTMETQAQAMSSMRQREPWNKGKLIGQKPPLRPKHVSSIRTRLQIEGRTRDLAMFNLAIDSKLRGCDVVALWVEDVAPSGYAIDRATVRQKKTGRPVRFELTEQTRQAVDDYIKAAGKNRPNFCSVVVVIAMAA
jgi:integrase